MVASFGSVQTHQKRDSSRNFRSFRTRPFVASLEHFALPKSRPFLYSLSNLPSTSRFANYVTPLPFVSSDSPFLLKFLTDSLLISFLSMIASPFQSTFPSNDQSFETLPLLIPTSHSLLHLRVLIRNVPTPFILTTPLTLSLPKPLLFSVE